MLTSHRRPWQARRVLFLPAPTLLAHSPALLYLPPDHGGPQVLICPSALMATRPRAVPAACERGGRKPGLGTQNTVAASQA